MTASIRTQLPRTRRINGKVLFIDTEGTFATQRVYQIAQAAGS